MPYHCSPWGREAGYNVVVGADLSTPGASLVSSFCSLYTKRPMHEDVKQLDIDCGGSIPFHNNQIVPYA